MLKDGERLKHLSESFSYDRLVKTCEEKNWRIPSLEEIKGMDIRYDCFWVSDSPTSKDDIATHARVFDETSEDMIANKGFIYRAVVIAIEKVCTWTAHDKNEFVCSTSCGNGDYHLSGDAIFDNRIVFCPYCGSKIKKELVN